MTAAHGLAHVGSVSIIDNPSLAAADAQALVDDIDTIDGDISLSDNGP